MVKQYFSWGVAAFLAALVLLTVSQAAVAATPVSTKANAAALAANRPLAPGIVLKLRATNERLKMTVNTSRIVTLEKQVPQVQVSNPEILQLTVLSPTQVQLSAKAPGVTQVNIWDENNQIFTIDVIVFNDARELQEILGLQFPNTSLKVMPVANSAVISGFVDKPEIVPHIIRIAEEYYPKVINNITVGGVHQVLLHCKVMEVSRSKLRKLGFDFSQLSTGGGSIESTIADTIAQSTLGFRILGGGGSGAFIGVLEALREDSLLKIMSEPTLLCYSGRPATFIVGGEFPILVPQSLGTVSIEYKEYGTQLDFVPIVLGNGRIRLEVRPRVSEIDDSRSVEHEGFTIPALKTRQVETGVELNAGQTLAIAGLVEEHTEAGRRVLPWIGEVPYLGVLFGGVENKINEIELLILVTPELVDAMNPDEVPTCLPGTRTDSPDDCEFYLKRYIEVPKCCPPGSAGTGMNGEGSNGAYCPQCNKGELIIKGGNQGNGTQGGNGQLPGLIMRPTPAEPVAPPAPQATSGVMREPNTRKAPYSLQRSQTAGGSRYANPSNCYMPSKQTYTTARRPQNTPVERNTGKTLPGFIGPVGYDVVR